MRIPLTIALAAGAAGCMVNPAYLPDRYSAARLADGRLHIAIAPEKYRELGGAGSQGLNSFIAGVVTKEGACPDGFSTEEPMPVRGYYSIVVACKGKAT